MTLDINKAISFLRNVMWNHDDRLVNESTKDQIPRYYINSANGLYYTVIKKADPNNAASQLSKAVYSKNKWKPNSTLYTMWADVLDSEWKIKMKTKYAFKSATEQLWGKLKNGYVYNNNSDLSTRSKDENKINIKCFYAINKVLQYRRTGTESYLKDAKAVWLQVLNMFDDSKGGYVDSIEDYREAYKQGLVKVASKLPELKAVGDYQEATGMWDGTLQNAVTGGIYMRYIRDSNGSIVNNGRTFENTESTAAIILGYSNDYTIK